ncbi:MAG: protein kinase [Pyrinomonadaceae bacterium]
MNFADIAGQTLDEKYRIERELGRGGMGTVYLATHLGTERPVAVKIIAPQFMKRPEFVERFRREARAAGRLRHPNVVDVTDFGFSHTPDGQVAYLVMEYLDGCTLGEILEEENNLPVGWTLDILEQVCSAVHEAHEQGIIHRDLKPDNIWLEPNQRGGYTVKVLDFGIAKLEEHADLAVVEYEAFVPATATLVSSGKATMADVLHDATVHDSISPTRLSAGAGGDTVSLEAGTLIQQAEIPSETATSLFPLETADQETVGTKIISGDPGEKPSANGGEHSLARGLYTHSDSGSDLTRVGAVLGTPLYMSPEQCRGDKLDTRSDIYSLGVIAYQMLSGKTPFSGDFTHVMESHKEIAPPPLDAKKVRKKLKRVISSAMAKLPEDRPQTAEAFASSLRSRSEGIFGLLRRAGMIYTEHMPKFLMLSAFFHIPMVVLTVALVALSFMKVSGTISSEVAGAGIGLIAVLLTIVTSFCAHLIIGTITWIVTQSLAVPLRPIKLRSALTEARKKWKTFAGTGIFSTVMSFVAAGVFFTVGFLVPFLIIWATVGIKGNAPIIAAVIGVLFAIYGFLAASVLLILVTPSIMMENLRGWKAVKRSFYLVRRSTITAFAAFVIMFLIPMFAAGMMSFVVNITAKALDPKPAVLKPTVNDANVESAPSSDPAADGRSWSYRLGNGTNMQIKDAEPDMQTQLKNTVLETLLQIFLLPIQIVVISFTAIIIALLYLKTRQAGGEPLQDLLGKFEETEQPRKKWQERVRQRLIQSGRITNRS